jgi:hypothetical protein
MCSLRSPRTTYAVPTHNIIDNKNTALANFANPYSANSIRSTYAVSNEKTVFTINTIEGDAFIVFKNLSTK